MQNALRSGQGESLCVPLRCRPLEAQMTNLECNAVSAVQITHHFLAQMVRYRKCIPITMNNPDRRFWAMLTAASIASILQSQMSVSEHGPSCGAAEAEEAPRVLRLHIIGSGGHRVALHSAFSGPELWLAFEWPSCLLDECLRTP